MRLRIAAAAREDLKDIWDYVAQASSDTIADRLVRRIRSAVDHVPDHPHSGTPRDDLIEGLRMVLEAPYLVFYVVEPRSVIVTRIVHGARDLAALARTGHLT